MSILNKINVDYMNQPLFLGEGLSLQRFDRFKHPVFFDLFNKQLTQFWRPEEISLALDRGQFQELADHEKFIFTKNLLFQTMLDSVVARGVPVFTNHVSNPELEICLNTWGFFENIHSYSYTYIIKNVYADPSSILDQALQDKEILLRADSVTKAYDDLAKEKLNLKEKIYLSLISVNILEALRFYVSFVCAFAFGENKKMIGNADIISLIKKDEACCSDDTMALTPLGWKFLCDLNPEDLVAQYTKDFNIEFVKPYKIIEKEYSGEMISVNSKINHIDMLLTPDHRVVFNQNGEWKEQQAKDFKAGNKKILMSGKIKNPQVKHTTFTDHDRLLVAIQADGTIESRAREPGKWSGTQAVWITLSKQRKIDRLNLLLNKLQYEYTVKKDSNNRMLYRIKVPIEYPIYKNFDQWVPAYDTISLDWAKDFIEEIVLWDGSVRSKDSYYYSSSIPKNTEIVQNIAMISGYKTYQYKEMDDRKDSYKTIFRLSIMKYLDGHTVQKAIISNKKYEGKVYCVSVPSGMFLAKRNNSIFVTGNCHLAITQNIINILRTDKSEGFTEIIKSKEPEAIQMFADAVNEEKAWASYLFQYGSVLGLNERILHQYIEWLADTRMNTLGLPKMYNAKNPIGSWLEPWINSSAVQVAPQETEITSYLKASVNNDIGTFDFGDLGL